MRVTLPAAVALLSLTACFHDVGALTGATTTGTSGTSGDPSAATTTTATSAGSSGATDPSTSVATTTDASTSGTTTATNSTTDTTTGGPTTGSPEGCWGLPPYQWGGVTEIAGGGLGVHPRAPRIHPDGLNLYYIATTSEGTRPYKSTRASLDDPFLLGEVLIPWGGIDLLLDAPNLLGGEQEIILAGDVDTTPHLMISTLMDGVWPTPQVMAGPVPTVDGESSPSVSEDGSRLLFQRYDGPVNEALQGPVARIHEATRPIDAPPGTAYVAPTTVEIAGITDDAYPHYVGCPTISPDGLHLLFGSTYPVVLNTKNIANALRIFSADREELDAPWSAAVEIEALTMPEVETCPSAITRDGCTLVFHTFVYGADEYRIYLVRRSP
ncbi:MAG: hypothetical protein R3B09_21380 [Nannocystaceae bacterium]